MSTGGIVFVIMLILFGCLNLCCVEKDKETAREMRDNGIVFYDFSCEYLGGLPDLQGGRTIAIKINKDDEFIIANSRYGDVIRTFTKDDLIDAEIMTESQINQEVSTGKILTFGLLAFGMKEEETTYNHYLVITYKYRNEERKIILKPSINLQYTIEKLRDFIGVTY